VVIDTPAARGLIYIANPIFGKIQAASPVVPEHIAWLKNWSQGPASTAQVKGLSGPMLALGGAYERAFQDFLLGLAETKSPAAVLLNARWEKVVTKEPAPGPEESARVKQRIEAIKPLVARATPENGKAIEENLCQACRVLGGKGFALDPPLDGSSQRDLDGLLTAVLAPNEAIEQAFRLFRIELKNGSRPEGFKVGEDGNEVTLRLMGGVVQKVSHGEIQSAGYLDGRSVTPPWRLACRICRWPRLSPICGRLGRATPCDGGRIRRIRRTGRAPPNHQRLAHRLPTGPGAEAPLSQPGRNS
jgi:putative heme-binding domain-containing protein